MNNNTCTEIWKDISGYEALYQVSNFGRVRSLERVVTYGERYHTVPERIKKPSLKKKKIRSNGKYLDDGYLVVSLYKENKGSMNYVHRLVANAFIPNPEVKETVNHIDGIKTNNHWSNLEWATYQENNDHAFETGLNDINNVIQSGMLKSKSVKQYDEKMNLIAEYPSMRAAERANGMSNGLVSLAVRKEWLSGGYYWKI